MPFKKTEETDNEVVKKDLPPTKPEYLYPSHINGCPRCGDKLRSDGHGSKICAIAAKDCPQL